MSLGEGVSCRVTYKAYSTGGHPVEFAAGFGD